jgi:membrane protein
MRIKGKDVWPLLKETVSSWSEDKAPKMSAALATYAMLSLAPLLVIITKVAAIYYSKGAGTKISETLQGVLPGVGAEAIEKMIAAASKPGQGKIATVLSIIMAAYGATGVFGELQDSMNTIWEVKPKPFSVWLWLRARFLSFATVLGIAFLLMVSTVGTALVTALGSRLGGGEGVVAFILTHVVSLAMMTALFGLMFRLLPDAKMGWSDVLIGAAISAVLFEIGKVVLAIYIKGSATQVFGAAGSLAAVLLWVYYSAFILFFGAEFTKVYTKRYGSGIKPSENAVKVTEEDRAQQGMVSGQRLAAKTAEAEGRGPARRPAPRRAPAHMVPGGTPPAGNGDGKARQYALAGAGVVVGAIAGALGAKSLMDDPSRPARRHIQAVRLNDRLNRIEQKVGRAARMKDFLDQAGVYERVSRVERQIRHARTAMRSQVTGRPGWLVRLGDAIAGNK